MVNGNQNNSKNNGGCENCATIKRVGYLEELLKQQIEKSDKNSKVVYDLKDSVQSTLFGSPGKENGLHHRVESVERDVNRLAQAMKEDIINLGKDLTTKIAEARKPADTILKIFTRIWVGICIGVGVIVVGLILNLAIKSLGGN